MIESLTLHPMQTPPPSILPSVLMLPLSASTFKLRISVQFPQHIINNLELRAACIDIET